MRFDGLNSCIIGKISIKGLPDRICYDYEKVVELIMDEHSCDYEDAVDYVGFNILDAYIGEETPAFLFPNDDDDELQTT